VVIAKCIFLEGIRIARPTTHCYESRPRTGILVVPREYKEEAGDIECSAMGKGRHSLRRWGRTKRDMVRYLGLRRHAETRRGNTRNREEQKTSVMSGGPPREVELGCTACPNHVALRFGPENAVDKVERRQPD